MDIKNICIIGMGYVGLTMAVVMAEKGFSVTGVEVNNKLCAQLKNGVPHFHEKKLDTLLKKHINKKLLVQSEIPRAPQDVFIVCVSTPVENLEKEPILDYIIKASESVAERIRDGNLVILRSTVPVGTTRNIVKKILDRSGKKYMLAFCPERTAEGNAIKELQELPQIVGGINEESTNMASNMFRKIIPTIVEVPSLESAEMVKLLNNTYRDLNFAFANEVALICESLKLDAVEIIKAANLGYPRSNIPVPGFVGGACLEKDPYILAYDFKNNNCKSELILRGRKINEMLPNHVVSKIKAKFLASGKKIDVAKILVMGFGFKGHPETDDMRGSLTLEVVKLIKSLGCKNIYGHDFVVKNEDLERVGVIPVSLEDGFRNADCVVFSNNHEKYYSIDIENLISTLNKPSIFIDVWHIFNPNEIKRDGILYGGVGVD